MTSLAMCELSPCVYIPTTECFKGVAINWMKKEGNGPADKGMRPREEGDPGKYYEKLSKAEVRL